MTPGQAVDPYQPIVDRLAPGARVERSWPLAGGVSATVVAVAFTRPDGAQERVVVRRPEAHAWKPERPDGLAREHAVLGLLHARGLPVPRPRLLDPSGALVLDLVDGTTALPADPAGPMAAVLAEIHATPPLPVLPVRDDPLPELLEWLPGAPALHAALRARGPFRGAAALLHGDFWPGNLVWRDGAIVAVLDWEDCAAGDPLSDLACARAELTCAAGEAAAHAFTARYLGLTAVDAARLPVWDLYVATAALLSMDQWGLPPDVLAARRAATEAFQRGALRALGLA